MCNYHVVQLNFYFYTMTQHRPFVGNGFLIKLSDIEARYRTTLYEILQAASKKRIELLFEVPPGKKLILLPIPLACYCEHPPFGIPHPFDTKPDYLVLLPGACEQLIREPFVQTKYSAMGYARKWAQNWLDRPAIGKDDEGLGYAGSVICELIPKPAKDADKIGLYPVEALQYPAFGIKKLPWMHWGLDSENPHDPAAWFKVEIEDLYVITQEFFGMKGWAKNTKPNELYFFHVLPGKEPKKNNPRGKNDFLSARLLRACEASEKLWGCETVIPGQQESYPTNDEVVRWLMDQDTSFAKDSAEHVARLIRPEFADQNLRPIPPDKKQGKCNEEVQFHSERLLLACMASLELWGGVGVKPDERDTHPSNQVVIDWLQKKNPSFKKDDANHVASLIRPSFSEAKGRYSK